MKLDSLRQSPIKHRRAVWPIVLATTVVAIAVWPFVPTVYRTTEVLLAAVGGIWGAGFFFQQRHIEDAHFMKELFEYFNKRYDDQNNDLQAMLQKAGDFDATEKLAFIDYFNLCAEEWVFRKAGYIYDEVWEAWRNGMLQFGRDARVKALWQSEKGSNSYYSFEFPTDVEHARS